ncbi:HD-GYP domain-containing protein [Sterolibacterium denitrificans]|nr:HD domain-containing phosphohydrolase [Sterolibacterium denitrificans]
MRAGPTQLPRGELFAETLLLALDRLELAVEALIDERPLEQLKLDALVDGLERLVLAGAADFEAAAIHLLEAVTGFRPLLPASMGARPNSAIARSSEQIAADLLFFRLLNKQYEARSPLFEGRRQRLLKLALETNEEAGTPIDPVQLEAAVYIHDVGMMFLPESLWLKAGKLNEDERFRMQIHPVLAAGLLERMAGWQSAAEMVAQHHEMPDGGGYPRRLRGEQICAGAKLLAIVDAFEAVMFKHGDRGATRSMLRAIAEINACSNQFAAEWVRPFNRVIRRMLEK